MCETVSKKSTIEQQALVRLQLHDASYQQVDDALSLAVPTVEISLPSSLGAASVN